MDGNREVLTAPQSPWQNAYVERMIGSIRRECLDHVIVFNQSALCRVLKSYFEYYDHTRTHLSLSKDSPIPRSVQPPEMGMVVEVRRKSEDSITVTSGVRPELPMKSGSLITVGQREPSRLDTNPELIG